MVELSVLADHKVKIKMNKKRKTSTWSLRED